MSTHIGALTWPDPGVRALEIAMAVALAFCALVLRGSRWPQFPSLPQQQQTRADPLAVAWTSIRLHRPNVPEFVWALLGGIAVGLFVGGPAALPAGLIGTIGTFVWLARRRTQADLRDKVRLSAQIPPLADLFAAGLAAGLQPAQAAVTVAQAFGSSSYVSGGRAATDPPSEPDRSKLTGIDLLACRFHDAATAVLAGADPQAAWGALAFDEATAPLAAAVIRADRTGAPAAATVGRAARELRDAAADALAAEVRTVGVRATAPLTLCFLPAFVFLGVLPTALSLLSRLHA
jgi:Type II secretion system (T2SS), protein F